MNITRLSIMATVMFFINSSAAASDFRLERGETVNIECDSTEAPVVHTAISLLARDMKYVLDCNMSSTGKNPEIIVCTVGKGNLPDGCPIDTLAISGKSQAFLLDVLPDGELAIVGSDQYGTAYGIMEISRLLGVSPWEWWADVTPEKKQEFRLPEDFTDVQYPSVEYRGIFINDEDWGLMPWSSYNYEPWYKPGRIGPRTNERIFELMLRLRANTYWPAMHECTVPFFLTDGNREVAKKYGIFIGGSHCEPMACSTAGEWPRRGKGEYNYVSNAAGVYDFWEKRVKEVAGQDIFYTLGMRGVHDGAMNGVWKTEDQKRVLEQVFADQQKLLRQYVNEDLSKVPQVFIPYKEVQKIYDAGLRVPDEATLMWCDDNFGYIRHFPDEKERKREAGNGVYYHVSYWGGPHDYLWLGTASPYLVYQQMKTAYDNGIQKLWILNVGDIKPLEYQIELFMDMAWNIEEVSKKGVRHHLDNFLCREFGSKIGTRLSPVINEHYRLAYIRKPEFMGNQDCYGSVEARKVKDMPWSLEYMNNRLDNYCNLSDSVESLWKEIPQDRKDAFYQLVKYPVQGAAEMNKKLIYAQMARHGLMDWTRSDAAYDSICALTRIYNIGIDNNGKWSRMMDCQPRRLPVFEPVERSVVNSAMPQEQTPLYKWNGNECTKGRFREWPGLGYEGGAVEVSAGDELEFDFNFNKVNADSLEFIVTLLPNNPPKNGRLRFRLSFDGVTTGDVDYLAEYHKDEWAQNVLSNQAVRKFVLPVKKSKGHKLKFKSLDDGVVLDRIMVYVPEKQFETFPSEKDMSAYLMVFHKDDTHSLHMAISRDGYSFTALNDGKPVIAGDTIAMQRGIRDPHIYRGPDGAFYMAMTDLHIYARENGYRDRQWDRDAEKYGWGNNRGLVLMKSRDLVNWTHNVVRFDTLSDKYHDMAVAWAPETIFDDKTGKMMIYYTMGFNRDMKKLYYVYVNDDFNRLESMPELLFEYPDATKSAIDADIVKVGDRYIMHYKSQKGIMQAVSDRVNGGYRFDPHRYDSAPVVCEAPTVWKRIGEEKWVLVYDIYGRKVHNFGFRETSDFKSYKDLGEFNEGVMKSTNFTSPKHGAVVQITTEEADRLEKYWSNRK